MFFACVRSFRVQDYHLLWLSFPAYFTNDNASTTRFARNGTNTAYNPYNTTTGVFRFTSIFPKKDLDGLHVIGLDCSHFARHYSGNVSSVDHLASRSIELQDDDRTLSFLFLVVLRCFTSHGYFCASIYSMHNI